MARTSFSERYKARRYGTVLEEKEEEKSSSSDKIETTTKKERGSFSDRYKAQKLERSIGLDTFETDLASVSDLVNTVYGGWHDADTMQSAREKVSAMNDRLNKYNTYIHNTAGDADLTQFDESMGKLLGAYNSALSDWDNIAGTYGNYINADAYNAAKKKYELSEKYKDMNFASVQDAIAKNPDDASFLSQYGVNVGYSNLNDYNAELEALAEKIKKSPYAERQSLQMYYDKLETAKNQYELDNKFDLYKDIMQNEDFAANSGYNGEEKNFFEKLFVNDTYDLINAGIDTNKSYFEQTPTERNYKGNATILGKGDALYMTDEEKSVYNYLYNTQGEKAAEDFYNDMKVTLSKRKSDSQAEKTKEATNSLGWFSNAIGSALSIPWGLVGGVTSFVTDAKYKQYGMESNPYDSLHTLSNVSDTIRDTTRENLSNTFKDAEIMGTNVPAFLYDTVLSMGESALGAGALGKGASVVLGMGAASSTAKDLKDAGASEEDITKASLIAGAAEFVFEKLSIDKLLKTKDADTFGKLIRNTLSQAGVEASEEVFTEIANQISDYAIRGGTSDYASMLENFIERGYTEEEAKKKANEEIAKQIALSGIGGAISGGIMGGVATGAEYSGYKDIGKVITNNNQTGTLAEVASGTKNDAYTDYINLLNNGTATKAQVGNLYNKVAKEVNQTASEKFDNSKRGTIASRLVSMGETSESARTMASAVYKSMFTDRVNEKLTREERNLLKTDNAKAVISEIKDNAKWFWKSNLSKAADNAVKTSDKLNTVFTPKSAESIQIEKRVASMNTGTETIDNQTGNKIEIEGMSVDENGNTVLQTSEGVRSLDEVTLTDNDAEVIAMAEGMDGEKADLFVSLYKSGTDVEQYKTSFDLAFSYGENAYGADEPLKNRGVLTEAQVASVYELGMRSSTATQQKEIDAITKKHFAKTDYIVPGTFDDSTVNYKKLNGRQKAAVAFTKMLSEKTGVNVVFFESKADANGRRTAENGRYERESNTIYVDAYAGLNENVLEDSIVPTLSHELTHWMKDKAPEAYNNLSSIVMGTLAKDMGVSPVDLVGAERNRFKQAHGVEVSEEYAQDELIARACEDMLTGSKQAKDIIAQMDEKTAKTFAQKFKEFVEKLKEWMADLLNVYKSNSSEAKIIRKYADRLNELQEAWDDAFDNAMKANQALNKGKNQFDTEKMAASDRQYSDRINSSLNEIGLEFDEKTGTVYSMRSLEDAFNYDDVREFAKAKREYVDALMKATGKSRQKCEEYLNSLFLIHDMIAKDRDRLDYEAAVNKSAWVGNVEYGGSIDFSTLCAKRRLFTGTFDAIQTKMPNTVLTDKDFLKIRNLLLAKEYESPCSMCYVEGSRAKSGKYVKKWLDEYLATNPSWRPTLADFTTATGLERTRIEHREAYESFQTAMNKLSQRKPKEASVRTDYKGEILKAFADGTGVEAKNVNGGIRFNSFSDFEIIHALDCMQVITDMARVGLAGQAYTKVKEFAECFGNTGMKINMSLVAKGVDKNGKLVFDEVNGMKYADAMDIRNKYSENVGTVIVCFDDAQIRAALADETIDFVLPFHRSQWSKNQYAMMGLPTTTRDYTSVQNDRFRNPASGRAKKVETGNIMPKEYWDFDLSGRENAQRYLDYINKHNYIPKFDFVLSRVNGKWTLPEGAVGDGYFKLLIDFKMYNNEGVGAKQNPVVPEFNMDYIRNMLSEYTGGHNSFPIAHDVVDEFVSSYKKNPKAQFSDRDSEGNGLTKEQIEFFKDSKVRDKDGNLMAVYHGSENYGFTTFDPSLADDGISLFFTNDIDMANSYVGDKDKLYKTYLNINNPYKVDAQGHNWNHIRLDYSDDAIMQKVERLVDISMKYDTAIDIGLVRESLGNIVGAVDYLESEMRAEFEEDGIEASLSEKDLAEMREIAEELDSAYDEWDEEAHLDEDGEPMSMDYYIGYHMQSTYTTRQIAKMAKKQGYDGVIIENVYDNGKHHLDTGVQGFGNVYIAFDSNQIKSVDNQNPTEDSDIRYSERQTESIYDAVGELKRLQKENEKLKKDVERLRQKNRLERTVTGGVVLNDSHIETVAGHILKNADSRYDKESLAKELKDIYEYLQSEGVTWDIFMSKATDTAQRIIADAREHTVTNDYAKMILDTLRTTRVSLNETQKNEAKYAYGKDWNKMYFGRVLVTNDGMPLETMWSEWSAMYPDVFDADLSDAEMATAVLDAYDAVKASSEVVEAYDNAEWAREIAVEIYNQFWNVSPVRTLADKHDKAVKQLKYEHRVEMQEMKEKYNQRKMEAVYKTKEHYKQTIQNLKGKRAEEIKRIKEKSKEYNKAYREKMEKQAAIDKITKKALKLNTWLVKNSKDEHVSEILKKPVAAVLKSLNFSSERLLGLRGGDKVGEPTNKDISLSKAFEGLADMVANVNDAQIGEADISDLYGYLDLPSDFVEFVRDTSREINDLLREVGDNEYILNQMSLDQLDKISSILTTLSHTVTQTNKALAAAHGKSIANLAQDTMISVDRLGKHSKLVGKVTDFFNFDNALPMYAFKQFGEGGQRIFEAMQDGWDKFAFNVKEIMDYSNSVYDAKEVQEWSKEVHEFDLLVGRETVKVKMTTAQMMSLYALQKREQAKGHLIGGGIRVADFKEKKGTVSQPDGATLRESDITRIVSELTDRQIEVADRLQEFMNTVCTDWGNEISMTRFGYKGFGEENYFPIKSDANNLAQDDAKEKENSLFRLLNMSFTKGTIKNANNRVVIDNIFDVFAAHTSDMAKYNALALPVLDAFKWYNYKEKSRVNPMDRDDKRFNTIGVKQSLEKAYGAGAKSYIVQFLRDINGANSGSLTTTEQFSKKLISNYKVAAVGANLRVAILQPTAYVRASLIIDPKYLAKAFAKKPQIEKSKNTCGIALWKSMGFYDTNISKGVMEQIKHEDTWYDKVKEGSMKLAEWGDSMTWGYLYNACEAEVSDTQPGLTGEAKDEAIAKRLREVIYSTQVVDSTMTRTQTMRNPSTWNQILTSFMSEPMVSYNLLHDCYMQFNADKRAYGSSVAFKKNGRRIARAAFTYMVTTLCAATAGSLIDTMRDDEEEKSFGEVYFANVTDNALSDVLSMLPIMRDVVSIYKGFGSNRMDMQGITSAVNASKKIMKSIEKGEFTYSTAYSVMKAGSQLSGLPVSNAMRDVIAIWNSTVGEVYESMKIK